MIALKLVIQSLAGATAVVACGGAGYYVTKESNVENFYLVSSTVETSSIPNAELWTEESPKSTSTKDTKNYKCESANKNFDEDCDLYSISFDTTNKSISLSTLNDFVSDPLKNDSKVTKTTKKTELTTKHFFLLKASNFLFSVWRYDGTKTIKLSSNSSDRTESTKSYSTLKVLAKLASNEVLGKTNLVIAKATTLDTTAGNLTVTTDNAKSYSCKLKKQLSEESKPCFISQLTDPAKPPVNFSAIKIPTTQEALTIVKDKYFLITWTGSEKYSFSSLLDTVLLSITNTNNNTQTLTTETHLSISKVIFAHPTTGTVVTEVIVVN